MIELLVFLMHYVRQLFGRRLSPHAELIPVRIAGRRQAAEYRYAGWTSLEAMSATTFFFRRASDTHRDPTGGDPPGGVSPGCPPDLHSST